MSLKRAAPSYTVMPILPYPFGRVILNKSIITPSEGLLYKGDAGVTLSAIAVLLIVLGKNFHLRTITHTISVIVRKTWRWKS
jgi:hypothetical protein